MRRDTRIRQRLQACESRVRRALAAVDEIEDGFVQPARPLAIADLARVAGLISAIRAILSGGEVEP
jgi:hypothetical protein